MGSQQPIGVYDSGLGGLTVVRWLRQLLPQECIVYFGDTARVPYGGRSREEITTFSRQIISFFLEQGVKFVIAACNTSSALALPTVRVEFNVSILGVIGPGANDAVRASKTGRIGVIATEGTVSSRAYTQALVALDSSVLVWEQPCPRLVPLVEAGQWDGAEVEEALREYLAPLQVQGIDTLILGCTHYPFLTAPIKRILGPEVNIVDPAKATVLEAAAELESLGLLSESRISGVARFFVSGDPLAFTAVASRMGYVDKVGHVDIEMYGTEFAQQISDENRR